MSELAHFGVSLFSDLKISNFIKRILRARVPEDRADGQMDRGVLLSETRGKAWSSFLKLFFAITPLKNWSLTCVLRDACAFLGREGFFIMSKIRRPVPRVLA